jgi:plasmid stabilization system protein ParE
VTRVLVTPAARDDLARLIRTHSLPRDTTRRVVRSLRPLAEFPLLGAPLEGRWKGFRSILGPWRWMVVVYVVDDGREQVSIVTIQDARSATSATGYRAKK